MRDIQKTKIPRHSADRLSNKANSFIDMPFLNGHEAMTIYSLKQAFRLNDRSLVCLRKVKSRKQGKAFGHATGNIDQR